MNKSKLFISAEAQSLTNKLSSKIHTLINTHGPIAFSKYMQMALYTPGLGYYMAGQTRFGKHGDFITAPLINPLFGQIVALFLHNNCCINNILELGAGNGMFAAQILLQLEQLQVLPRIYYILEVSASLKQEQLSTLKKRCPHLLANICWLNTLPKTFDGTIVANEVLDALAIDCFSIQHSQILERCVTSQNNKFKWCCIPAAKNLVNQIKKIKTFQAISAVDEYNSEINLMLNSFIYSLAAILTSSSNILFIDYGYLEQQYYHPQRIDGTLSTHWQHQRIDKPLMYPGLQDISAHVNFSQVIDAAMQDKLSCELFTNQADFLLNYGLSELIVKLTNADGTLPYNIKQAIHSLTDPARMGEIFKILLLKKQ